ncbi:MAG: hypothetical protein ACYCV7_01735 [Acidimicrobiales bacterium]
MDMANARDFHYALTLHPDELRVVGFALDDREWAALESGWRRLGLTRLPLGVMECEHCRQYRRLGEPAGPT